MKPFWVGNIIEGESLFFIQNNEDELPCDTLLFVPDEILSVKSASREITYHKDIDYILSQSKISLPKGSSIPYKTSEEMKPPPNSPNSIPACRDGKNHLFFGEGHFFHDLQIEITYTHKENQLRLPIPEFALDKMPNINGKLKNKEHFKMVLFGDSISAGGNASGFTGAKPFTPPFGEIVAKELEKHYGVNITYRNHSVGGTASGWGLQNIGVVADEKPDLAILAFGMNDASGRIPPQQYRTNIEQQISSIKQSQPKAEFILVATMTGNPEWTASAPDLYPLYRDELASLCGEGIILADVTSMWTEILKRKSFASLTGNGVNHPNDFGHYIYAQIILSLLIHT